MGGWVGGWVGRRTYLEEGSDHIPEGVGVSFQQTFPHRLVLDEHVVGVFVDEVIDLAGSGGPVGEEVGGWVGGWVGGLRR